MNRLTSFLFPLLLVFISSCATKGTLPEDTTTYLTTKEKRNVRVLVSQKNEDVFEKGALEGFSRIFEVVEGRPYEIKAVPRILDYKLKVLSEKCSSVRGSGVVSCVGNYRIKMRTKLTLYDSDKIKILEITKSGQAEASADAQAFGHRNNRKIARDRARINGAGKANSAILGQLMPGIFDEVYNDPKINKIEKLASRGETTALQEKYEKGKLPFTAVICLPPNINDIKAQALFGRSIKINKERQSGTATADLGIELHKTLYEELEKRFTKVEELNTSKHQSPITYNPNDLKCLIELDYRSTTIANQPNPSITLDASADLKAPTGAIYKKIDIGSERPLKLGKGASFLVSIFSGVSILRAMTEGTFTKKALQNGCENAVDDAVKTILDEFDYKFVKKFSEFCAYDSAVKSRSLGDINHFLATYPESEYASELTEIKDDLMYDFAASANTIEPCIDYLTELTNGKHRNEIITEVEPMLFREIKKGNKFLCDMYQHYITVGENTDEVKSICNSR